MKNRGLIIAAAVLAALAGLLYWSNHHKPSDTTATALPVPSEPAPNILTLNQGDITKIELKKKDQDNVVITKANSGQWQITAPKQLGVDQTEVSGVLSTLATLKSDRLVEDKAANLEKYGLAHPSLEVVVTDKNSATHNVLVGDDTPTGNGAYVQLAGDPRVFTIASFTKTSLDKSLNELRDKRLITVEPDKVSRLELVLKQQSLEFGRDKDQWQILKPRPLRANATVVDELVRKLTSATIETSDKSEADKTAASFAAGVVVATAKLTSDTGTQQLEVRKDRDKSEYYAKSSVVDGFYRVAPDLGQDLDKKLDDFRNRKLFDFGLNDPGKIEILDRGRRTFLTKGGEDWFSEEGKKFEVGGARALVDKLRDLEAAGFTDSGFSTPVMEITVTSSDGKRVEKVLLSKAEKNPLAKRESEASLYVLDPEALENLQKLVADLKPESQQK